MHHYTTTTYQQLIPGEQQNQVWQHHVPILASSNGVLMHRILALTALHCAHNDLAQRDMYNSRALHYHGSSLRSFQEMVACASPATAEVIIVCAILLSMWGYASFQIISGHPNFYSILITLEIVRSSRNVSNLYQDAIIRTPIGIFLTTILREPLAFSGESMAQEVFLKLLGQVEHRADRNAIHHMQRLVEPYLAGANYRRSAIGWVASADDEYRARLREHHPQAILVFAYSSLLSRASEHECWWLAGWPDRVLSACRDVLSPADKEVIKWAGHEELIRAWGDEFATLARQRDEGASKA